MKGIEIPFGAKDSELCGWEYTIPEGMEAVVKDGKVIVRRKESEEERIRKAALEGIEYLEHKLGWDFIGDTDILDVKEYLERQKEQPMSAEEVLIRAGLKPYRDGNQWCVLASGNIQEGICGFGDTIDEAFYQFLMEVLEIQKKKQPAEWNEEDKETIEKTICILETNFKPNEGFTGLDINRSQLVDRLNSLRPQPKQKWSEEDSRILYNVISYVGYAAGQRGVRDDEFKEANSWLKSLKNRGTPPKSNTNSPSWKPSKVQMEALAWYSGNSGIPPTGDKAIKSLYNDLQKLL